MSHLGRVQTTPPCAENLRWHVFKEEPTITLNTLALMTNWFANTTDASGTQQIGRTNHRLPQPINGRSIFKYRDPSAHPCTELCAYKRMAILACVFVTA